MASALRQIGLANISSSRFFAGALCKIRPQQEGALAMQKAGISSRELRRDRPPRPPPFDWQNKPFNLWAYTWDPMVERFDDNTKMIIVDGPPAVGKAKFAQALAEELEMKYWTPRTFDDYLINPYGFDLRSLNDKLPVEAQYYDLNTFFKNPKDINVPVMQMAMLAFRVLDYAEGLAHILSTGQGVVMQKSPWTDAAFMSALGKLGYVSSGVLDYYKHAVRGTEWRLMKPHLVIYLDAPIDVVMKNIKKRNRQYEVNALALTEKFFQEIETANKNILRTMAPHSHLMIYDWSTEGDMGTVVEDIERLDFDSEKRESLKFRDWRWDREFEIKEKRDEYTTYIDDVLAPLVLARADVPEMLRSGEDWEKLADVLKEVESEQYAPGFNPKFDKGILFKLSERPGDRRSSALVKSKS